MIANFNNSLGFPVRIELKNNGQVISTNLWGKFYLVTDSNAIAVLTNLANLGSSAPQSAFQDVLMKYKPEEIGIPDPTRHNTAKSIAVPPVSPSITANPPATTVATTTPSSGTWNIVEDKEESVVEDNPPFVLEETQSKPDETFIQQLKKEIAEKILRLLSQDEFEVTPSARFVNSLANCAQESKDAAKVYFKNYFTLSDHPDKDRIIPLSESMEFDEIITKFRQIPNTKKINNRLEIYYGAPGTGKTTEALALYPNAKVQICSKEMTSDNLFRRFEFNDENGNPMFRQTALVDAMENGEPIILDEINLLPWSSIQDLQSLTDGKEAPYIESLKKIVHVKPGFKIIGTMNLSINGQTYGLSEALVDRAGVLKEFKMTADQLAEWAW